MWNALFNEKNHMLNAGFADQVENSLDIAIFGACVRFEVHLPFAALHISLTNQIRQIFWHDPSAAKIGFALSCHDDNDCVFSQGSGLRLGVTNRREIDDCCKGVNWRR